MSDDNGLTEALWDEIAELKAELEKERSRPDYSYEAQEHMAKEIEFHRAMEQTNKELEAYIDELEEELEELVYDFRDDLREREALRHLVQLAYERAAKYLGTDWHAGYEEVKDEV